MTNRILASYLANVATASEHAPFGVPGVWQTNAFFNNSLVWSAHSVARAQMQFDEEPTEANEERIQKAKVRLNTILALYYQYADEVACPKLELPHVERYLGLDKEPDVTVLKQQATDAAKLAVRNALISGRKTTGVFAAEYTRKLATMNKVREERMRLLDEVYSLVHSDLDSDMYDESEIEQFLERMHDQLTVVARGLWLYSHNALSDLSLEVFNRPKFDRLKATEIGCAAFLKECGVSIEELKKWEAAMSAKVAADAEEHAIAEAELEKQADEEANAFLAAEAAKEAQQKATKFIRHVKSDARVQREQSETDRINACKAEDAAAALAAIAPPKPQRKRKAKATASA